MRTKSYAQHERYVEICKKMELLGIKDVSTTRQTENGTRVWRLPIKYSTHPKFIEVASFATGYVRNQNGGYTNYQLNKRCESEPQYYPEYKWCDDKDCNVKTGKFHQYTTRACVLIPNEIDRLEYLIGYCLKNYYIKKANEVINGKYISKWEHEYKLERANKTTWQSKNVEKIGDLEDRIYELESQVDVTNDKLVNSKDYTTDLKVKLKKVTRECNHAYDCGLSDGEKKANETYSENTGAMERINDLEDKIIDLKAQLNHNHDFLQNVVKEKKDMLFSYEQTLLANKDLENKLATIERIARINASYR